MPVVKFKMEPPNPKQQEFFDATEPYIAYGGAKMGGKSWAMRRKFEGLALAYPGIKLLLLRKTYQQLRDNHIDKMQEELHGVAKYVESRYAFEFPNGSVIRCGYCDGEVDTDTYQGTEFSAIGFEEATMFTEYQLTQIGLSARAPRDDFKPRRYYTCNPGGPGHEFIKRLFIDRVYDTRIGDDGLPIENPADYRFIQATAYDNVAMIKKNPDAIRELEKLPPLRRRRLLLGDWSAVEGQFFEEFDRSRHVVPKPTEMPMSWRRFRAMDWGYNAPCSVLWFVVKPDGHILVYDEIYARQVLSTDIARRIREKTGEDHVDFTVSGVDAWQKHGHKDAIGGENVADDFMHMGVPLLRADNDRITGWQRIREMLADAPDGTPWLQITDNCKELIRTLPALTTSRTDVEDVDGKCEDHAPEALRYGCMTRPKPRAFMAQAEVKTPYFDPFRPAKNWKQDTSGFFYK